jgi:hypothetical protein
MDACNGGQSAEEATALSDPHAAVLSTLWQKTRQTLRTRGAVPKDDVIEVFGPSSSST